MEVGIYIRDYLEDPTRPMFEQIEEAAEVCRRAKGLGFSAIYMPQHFLAHPTIWMQPMQMLSRLAPDAEGLRLITGILLPRDADHWDFQGEKCNFWSFGRVPWRPRLPFAPKKSLDLAGAKYALEPGFGAGGRKNFHITKNFRPVSSTFPSCGPRRWHRGAPVGKSLTTVFAENVKCANLYNHRGCALSRLHGR